MPLAPKIVGYAAASYGGMRLPSCSVLDGVARSRTPSHTWAMAPGHSTISKAATSLGGAWTPSQAVAMASKLKVAAVQSFSLEGGTLGACF